MTCESLNNLLAGPQMKPAVERVQKWKQDMGLLLNDVWIHCNAHIEPALAGALTKVLLDIEEVLGEYINSTIKE